MTQLHDEAPPPWVAPFLAALKDGKGVKAAIARSGVAVSTLYTRRKRDSRFALEWDLAVLPHSTPGDRRAQARRKGSTKADRFIAKLTETSNISAAAAHAGVAPAWVYKRRREDPEFARRWRAALAEGYDNLEMELLARLRAGHSPDTSDRTRKFETATALRCLTAHRESVARERGRQRLEEEVITIESINAKIDALRLNRERGERAIAEARAENERRAAERQ